MMKPKRITFQADPSKLDDQVFEIDHCRGYNDGPFRPYFPDIEHRFSLPDLFGTVTGQESTRGALREIKCLPANLANLLYGSEITWHCL